MIQAGKCVESLLCSLLLLYRQHSAFLMVSLLGWEPTFFCSSLRNSSWSNSSRPILSLPPSCCKHTARLCTISWVVQPQRPLLGQGTANGPIRRITAWANGWTGIWQRALHEMAHPASHIYTHAMPFASFPAPSSLAVSMLPFLSPYYCMRTKHEKGFPHSQTQGVVEGEYCVSWKQRALSLMEFDWG